MSFRDVIDDFDTDPGFDSSSIDDCSIRPQQQAAKSEEKKAREERLGKSG